MTPVTKNNNLKTIKMNETLTADKGKVITAYNKAKNGRKVFLENLFGIKTFQPDVKQRVLTFEDACKELGIPVPQFITSGDPDDKAVIAFQKLTIIIRALNEGWKPNWGNFSEYKYYAWFKFQEGSNGSSGFGFSYYAWAGSYANATVGSRLCFKTKELAIYAGNQFTDLYKDYLTL